MKDINFFSVYDKRKNSSSASLLKTIMVIGGILILIVGGYVALTIQFISIKARTAEINAYLSSDEVVSTMTAIDTYNNNKEVIGKYSEMLDKVLANLTTGNIMNTARMDEIAKALPSGVIMEKFAVEDKNVEFVFRVTNVKLAAELVQALSTLDCFSSVTFTKVETTTSSLGDIQYEFYAVEVTAVLKEGTAE